MDDSVKNNILEKTENSLVFYSLSFSLILISLCSMINGLGFISSTLLSACESISIILTYMISKIQIGEVKVSSLITITISLLIMILNLSPNMISLAMFIMLNDILKDFQNLNYRKILIYFAKFSITIFGLIVCLYFLINFNNHDISMWRLDKVIFRKSLGFNQPNVASIAWLSIFFSVCGIISGQNARLKYLLLFIVSMAILWQTQSRTSMYVIMLVNFIFLMYGKKADIIDIKHAKLILTIFPIGLIFLSLYVLLTPINLTLNSILSGRIELYQIFYHEYGIHLLKTDALESAMFDNGYLQALLSKGILFFLCLFFVLFYIIISKQKYTLKQLVLFLGFFSIGFTETALQHFELFVPILLTSNIFNTKKGIEKLESKE